MGLGDVANNITNGVKGAVAGAIDTATQLSQYVPKTALAEINYANAAIPDAKVLAEKLLKSPAVSCSITVPVSQASAINGSYIPTTIPFYMSDNFGMGMGNKWSALIDNKGLNVFTKFLNAGSSFNGGSQVTLQSEAMSSVVWNGSTFDGFNVKCIFVATRRAFNPVRILQILSTTCLPIRYCDGDQPTQDILNNMKTGTKQIIGVGGGFIGGLVEGIANWAGADAKAAKQQVSTNTQQMQRLVDDVGMVAPLGFGLEPHDGQGTPLAPKKGTTVTLNIGQYFSAPDLVVENIGSINFSKELVAPPIKDMGKGPHDLYDPTTHELEYGFPLYLECQIKLRPFTLVDVARFNSYWKFPKATAGAKSQIKQGINNAIGINIL